MEQAILFEATIESGIIKIPEQYIHVIPVEVRVTLVPLKAPRIKMGLKSKAGVLSSGDFTALRLDTRNWKFDREEANERR
jgi:hypothetical protein